MEHVVATAAINMAPDQLWREVGSFQGVGAWHPMLSAVKGDGEQPGAVRQATGKDGSEQVERLVEMNSSGHFYRYVMEASAMPVTGYSAEFRIRKGGSGTSVVEWSSDFEVTAEPASQTVDLVRGFLEAGLRSLEDQYG